MKIYSLIAFCLICAACSPSAAIDNQNSLNGGKVDDTGAASVDPAKQTAACYEKSSFQICVPSINQGYRIIVPLAKGDTQAAASLDKYLRTKLPSASSSAKPTVISGELSPAETEVQKRYPQQVLYDISAYLPPFIQKQFNHLKGFSGPNCYATGLVASGVLSEDNMLYVDTSELELYLAHYFIEVSQPAFGDVVLYDGKDHVAYYLFEDLVFHKKGYNKGYGYRIAPLTKVFAAEPYEWKPSPFDSATAIDNPTYGEKPKKYYRKLEASKIAATPNPSDKEKLAIIVVNHIFEQMKKSAPGWKVDDDMGTMIENVISGLAREFSFMEKSASFEAQLAYQRLNSLESQAFQVIEESCYASPTANADRINKEHCIVANDFVDGLLKKVFAYKNNKEASAEDLAKMQANLNAVDRTSCKVDLLQIIQ